MTLNLFGEVNWLAALVATVAYFAIGGLWFSQVLFGGAWSRALGWQPEPDEKSSATIYVVPLLGCAISTVAVALLAEGTGTDTLGEGLVLGLVVGVGIAAAVLFVTEFFDPKKPSPMLYAAITAGYHLVGLVVVAAILAVWN